MIGAARATTTLLAAAVAGFLFWLGARVVDPLGDSSLSAGEYWLWLATLASAGFVLALSQLLGGWTKWGWPQLSMPVFVGAFLPALAVGLWILFFHQPGDSWLSTHIRSWSDDVGVDRFVSELGIAVPAIGFALGLLLGLTFDTAGPRASVEDGPPAAPESKPVAIEDGDRPAPGTHPETTHVTAPRNGS